MFGINVAASFGAAALDRVSPDSGVCRHACHANQYDVPMVSFAITASLALAFRWRCGSRQPAPGAGLAVIARFVQFIIVPILLIALARSPAVEHAAVRRNAFTDKVLPLVAIVVSVGLAVSYDYRCIFLVGWSEYFSIALIVITFIVVPAMAYLHYYRIIRRVGDRPSTR